MEQPAAPSLAFTAQPGAPVLEVRGLSVAFSQYGNGLARTQLPVIRNLSLSVRRGEILAVAGASGSGKSLLAHAVLGILPGNAHTQGTLRYCGQPLTAQHLQALRGTHIALVPQSVTYLDPLMRTGPQVLGPKPTPEKRTALQTLFARLSLPAHTGRLYPHQLSGGMARRVLFSTAVLADAALIIADEPTPGMSTPQAVEALQIFRQLADSGKAVLLITHDVDLALAVADTVAVFYAGTVLETTPAADFAKGPAALRHPYSKALWQAMPQNGFVPCAGTQPYAGTQLPGCCFAPRCSSCTAQCLQSDPPMRPLRGGTVRCFHAT